MRKNNDRLCLISAMALFAVPFLTLGLFFVFIYLSTKNGEQPLNSVDPKSFVLAVSGMLITNSVTRAVATDLMNKVMLTEPS